MISKDLFKSHPVPFQTAFRTNPRHLFHFCVICIFKGYKLNDAANDTHLHLKILRLLPPRRQHTINTGATTRTSEAVSQIRHSIKSATVHPTSLYLEHYVFCYPST